MRSSPTHEKPMAVPGPMAFAAYSSVITFAVMFHLAVKRYKLFPAVLMLAFGLQITAVVAVPVVVLVVRSCGHATLEERPFQREPVRFTWLPRFTTVSGFGTTAAGVWLASRALTEVQIWRAAAGIECAAFGLVGLAVLAKGGSAPVGVSLRKLALDAVRLACQLVALSPWSGGDRRLPRRSCDWLVRGADALALAVVALVLVCCHAIRARGAAPLLPRAGRAALGAAVLVAATLHLADVPGRAYLPDALWAAALCLGAAAVLPQMELIAQHGGVAGEAVSHHIALIFGSRLLAVAFWWLIRGTWSRGQSWTGWGILVAYTAELLLLSHYMCYYFRDCFSRGLFRGVPLVCAEM